MVNYTGTLILGAIILCQYLRIKYLKKEIAKRDLRDIYRQYGGFCNDKIQ